MKVSPWRVLAAAFLLIAGLGIAAYRVAILREDARQLTIVIPPGTAERIAAGDVENDDG